MPADRLQEIRARLDAATPSDDDMRTRRMDDVAELIAHARADIRWLLDELDAARERIAILRAEITDLEHADR